MASQGRGQRGYGEEGPVLLFTDLSCLFYRGELYGHTSPLFCLVKSPASFRAQCTSSKDSLQ